MNRGKHDRSRVLYAPAGRISIAAAVNVSSIEEMPVRRTLESWVGEIFSLAPSCRSKIKGQVPHIFPMWCALFPSNVMKRSHAGHSPPPSVWKSIRDPILVLVASATSISLRMERSYRYSPIVLRIRANPRSRVAGTNPPPEASAFSLLAQFPAYYSQHLS